jgi:hypothetical protein
MNDRVAGPAGEIVELVKAHPNPRYFYRKHAALRNLFGTDLMQDAIETAKLRIFLALASCLERKDEIEPLPDLDFNLKAGNLIVGFKDAGDLDRFGNDVFAGSQIRLLEPDVLAHSELYANFADAVEANSASQSRIKKLLTESANNLRPRANEIYSSVSRVAPSELEAWVSDTKPFHWFLEFPQIIRNGGFDVVIGNPPYIKKKDLTAYEIHGFKTLDCPDVYAVCYERVLQLLSPQGRQSFIVMLSLAFSGGFASLRGLLHDTNRAEWWSTFGKRPDSLFSGVQVCNTIVVLGPEGGSSKYSTRHNLFSVASRSALFQTIEYYLTDRNSSKVPIRGGVANVVASKLSSSLWQGLVRPSGDAIPIRPTGRYWFPVLVGTPPSFGARLELLGPADPGVLKVNLFETESRSLVTATLAGKIGYLWWSSIGDDFHAKPSEATQVRYFISGLSKSSALENLASSVISAARTATFATVNAGSTQINIRWNAVRDVTDRFDKLLLEELGLAEHWRALNIWYRQVMKSSGENANGRTLSQSEVESLIGW